MAHCARILVNGRKEPTSKSSGRRTAADFGVEPVGKGGKPVILAFLRLISI